MRGKRILIVVVLVCCALVAAAQMGNKLWVSNQYDDRIIRVYFVEDRETGTRCYAATGLSDGLGDHFNVAISCVPKR